MLLPKYFSAGSASSMDGLVTCVWTDETDEGERLRVLPADEDGAVDEDVVGGEIICHEGSGTRGFRRSSSWMMTFPSRSSVGESRMRAD